MLPNGLAQARAVCLLHGLLHSGTQLRVGRSAPNGFNGRRGLARIPRNLFQQVVHCLGQTSQRNGAQQH